MLSRILEWSLHHRSVVILGWAGIAILGILALVRLPLDAFPDTTPVQAQINTVAPSLGPLEIERQITRPIEWAISGLPRLAEVRSVSKFGYSQVTATFEDGTDIYLARQVLAERLQALELPPGIERPSLGPVATGLGEIFHYIVKADEGADVEAPPTLADLRTAQDWIIRPQLRSVPGVAEVNSWGGDDRQVHVVVDPASLARFELSLDELAHAIEANNANAGGGVLEEGGEAVLVQGIGIATTLDDVESMIVAKREGVPIRVRDVARVVDGAEIRRGAVTEGGRGEAVLGLGFMLMGENSRDVSKRLRLRLEDIEKSLPPGVDAEIVYDRSTLVDHVLHTVRRNLWEGALLVIAVLFAFLGNLRAGLLVAAAIPLSMLFAGNLMLRFGIAGSLMSLGAIDFGLIVDSSIIQVENVMRRGSEARGGRSALEVVRDAVIEVRKPTLFGELIIAIVYLPILTLEGIEGKLFRPMALTVLFALAGSMLLSLTLMPALSSLILKEKKVSANERTPLSHRFVEGLQHRYRPVVRFTLARPAAVMGGAGAVLLVAILFATRLGSEFVPRLWEEALVVNTVRLAGVSVDESVRYGSRIEQMLLEKFPDEIARIWTRTGTAEITTDPMGVELSDVFITLTPREKWHRGRSQDDLVRAMADTLAILPGMKAIFTQPIEMRVNEMVAGVRADVGVKIFGEDFDILKAKAREVEAVIAAVPGAADVLVEQITGQPMLEVRFDAAAAARHGVPVRDALAVVETMGRRPVGMLQEGERRFPIALRLDDAARRSEESVRQILVTGASGDRVPLSRVASVTRTEGPSTVNHEWGARRIVVQANVRGRDLGSFVRDVRRAIDAQIELPPGYYVRYGGQFEHLERARTRLMFVVPLALGLIFTLLYFTYGRVVDAARVFTGVPFAAVGGVLALWLRDMPFSISAGVGFVALSGVSVLADMVLVSTFRQKLADGLSVDAAIEEAAVTRLRPVLMTALVASLGFVPMAFNSGVGAEVQRPLATVVIGGVISSTLLTLVVLPALLRTIGRKTA